MNGQLPPRILQLAGLAIVIGSGVFWALTNRESVEFLSAGMTLITIGSFWNAQQQSTVQTRYEMPPRPGVERERSDGASEEGPDP